MTATMRRLAPIVLCAALVLGGCPSSTTTNDDAATVAGVGSAMAGASAGEPAPGAGMGGMGAGSSGIPAVTMPASGALDICARAIAHPADLGELGQLGSCAPDGIPLPCRVDSPEYLCSASPSSDATSLNQCRNASDCAVLDAARARADAKQGMSVSNIVRACGLPYLTQTAVDCSLIGSNTADCVVAMTQSILAPGLSASCADCFSQSLLCNLRCLQYCSIEAESPECVACMHVEGCRGLFYACSGLEPMN